MGQSRQRTVLFLCTGNYYRSRFAEVLFNSAARKMGLPWKACSRGLALERGVNNVGPMAASAIQALRASGIHSDECSRLPVQAVLEDFEKADRIVALQEAEHRPFLQDRFPAWTERMEYWHVEDAPDALAQIEREVMELMARLLGGGTTTSSDTRVAALARASIPEKPREKPVVRVGRETKGRRGKGVTIVSDLPLDDDGLRELAAKLKQRCGTGGTVKDRHIEIQGDQRDRLVAVLEEMGFKVKRVGG